MTLRRCSALVLAVACLSGADAEAKGLKPVSQTAIAVTGPVQLSASHITFGTGAFLHTVLVKKNTPFKDDIEGGVEADIYKVIMPKDPILKDGNRLCGGSKSVPVTYIVTWAAKDGSVWLAPSASAEPPAGMGDVCGTFNYEPQ